MSHGSATMLRIVAAHAAKYFRCMSSYQRWNITTAGEACLFPMVLPKPGIRRDPVFRLEIRSRLACRRSDITALDETTNFVLQMSVAQRQVGQLGTRVMCRLCSTPPADGSCKAARLRHGIALFHHFVDTVNSVKLEYGCRMIYANFPPFFCFGIGARAYSIFLASPVGRGAAVGT